MINYNPINTVVFKPRTYQEMATPIMQATQAHQDIENQLADLAMKSGQWEHVLSKEDDPETYLKYNNYIKRLNESIEQLQQNGLNQASRRNLLDSRQGYSTDILPIETSFKRRKEYYDELRKMKAQDPTVMTNYNKLSIDNLINNPDFNPQYLSGAKVTALVENQAKKLANELKSKPGQLLPTDNKYFLMEYIKRGYSADEIAKVIMNDKKASPILKGIRDNVLNSLGINEWSSIDNTWDKDTFTKSIGSYADSGLYAAIGNEDYKLHQDPYQMALLNDWMDSRRQARQQARQSNNRGRGSNNNNNAEQKTFEFISKFPTPKSANAKDIYDKWDKLTKYEKYLENIDDNTFNREVGGKGKADAYKKSLTETLKEKHPQTLGKTAFGLIPVIGGVGTAINQGLPILGTSIDYALNSNNTTSLNAKREFGQATNEQMGGGLHSERQRVLYNIKQKKKELQLPFGKDFDMNNLKDMKELAVYDDHYKLNAETWNEDFGKSIASNLLVHNQKDRDNKTSSGVYLVENGKKKSPISTNNIVRELHNGKIMGVTIKDQNNIFISIADKDGIVKDYSLPVEGISSTPIELMRLMNKGFDPNLTSDDRNININQAAKLIVGNTVQNYKFTEANNKQFDAMNTSLTTNEKTNIIYNYLSSTGQSDEDINYIINNLTNDQIDQIVGQIISGSNN